MKTAFSILLVAILLVLPVCAQVSPNHRYEMKKKAGAEKTEGVSNDTISALARNLLKGVQEGKILWEANNPKGALLDYQILNIVFKPSPDFAEKLGRFAIMVGHDLRYASISLHFNGHFSLFLNDGEKGYREFLKLAKYIINAVEERKELKKAEEQRKIFEEIGKFNESLEKVLGQNKLSMSWDISEAWGSINW